MTKEIEHVFKVPATKRYEYFIKKIADYEEVWSLYDSGWAVTEDDESQKMIPFWPKREFAEKCREDEWQSFSPKKIELEEFINSFLPDLKLNKIKTSIFYNNSDSIIREVDDLLRDILVELENY